MLGLHLNDLERKILHLGDFAVKIVKETVDEYSFQFRDEILATIPRQTSKLAESLYLTEIDGERDGKYGWSLMFKGSPTPEKFHISKRKGTRGKKIYDFTYHDLAFLLNYHGYIRLGSSGIADIRETGFIYQAVTKLKEINPTINERWRKAVDGKLVYDY